MKCNSFFCVALLTLVAGAVASTAHAQITTATAQFSINPTGCRETRVWVEVRQTKEITDVVLTYDVQSTCPDGDFLYYHSITAGGDIPKRQFRLLSKGTVAILDTVIPGFDDEGGTDFDMGLQVIWFSTGRESKGVRPAVAALRIDIPFESPYLTDFLFPSQTASISREK